MKTILPQDSNLGWANTATIDIEKLAALNNLDTVFQPGEPKKSGFQSHEESIHGKPVTTTMLSESAISEGAGNTAGLKGYRWTEIDFTNNKITFAVEPAGWEAGDVVSIIVNGQNDTYKDCATITSVDGNVVELNEALPFDAESIAEDGDDFCAKTAYVTAKPSAGDVDIGVCAHAEGLESKAVNLAAHAEGLGTVATNQSEHAQGQYNVSNPGTVHSIGVGESDSSRKNAVEVMRDGKVYVVGVGGYDGTTTDGKMDLAEKVNSNKFDSIMLRFGQHYYMLQIEEIDGDIRLTVDPEPRD